MRLFHGSGTNSIGHFSNKCLLENKTEANSALGLHTTMDPGVALDYASIAATGNSRGFVYILEADIRQIAVVDFEVYLGRSVDEETPDSISRSGFSELRARLIRAGFSAVACSEGPDSHLDNALCILDAESITIIECLTAEDFEARLEVDESLSRLEACNDTEFTSIDASDAMLEGLSGSPDAFHSFRV